MPISNIHADHLRSEGFTDADIVWMEGLGVRSISEYDAKQDRFAVESGGGLLFPFTRDFAQLRTDNPPMRGGKPAKYLTQTGRASQAWMPDGAKVLTEGFKDAAIGTLRGCEPTGALAGVSHYKKALPKNCGHTIVFDADGWVNPSVFASLVKAAQWCNGKIQLVPEIAGQPKAGLCEYFKAGHTAADYKKLIDSALNPKQFLLELPNQWKSLPVDRVGRTLRTVFALAREILDPASLDLLTKSCKRALKPHGVAGETIDRELKLTRYRVDKKRRERKMAEWAAERSQNPELDLTDVPSGAESRMMKSMRSVNIALGKDLRLNGLTNNLEFKGSPLDPNTYQLFLAKLTDLDISEAGCVQILGAIGKKHAYHPVKEWLEQIHQKHGNSTVQMLNTVSSQYLHTSNPLYNRYMLCQMVAAVARVYQPGCKSDHSVIIQGGQNLFKSTFWNVLAGDDWFDDNLGSDVENKDELQKLHRTWFEEWGEIDRITTKKELGVVKSFLSRKIDTFRAPYERTSVEHPRRGVIVGTVNPTEFLRDEEDRRLWIIPITQKIDIEGVRRDRELLWAAAVALYKGGTQWWLTSEEEELQRESNKQFALPDVWEEKIESWVLESSNQHTDRGYVRVQDILSDCLEIKEIAKQTNLDKKRVQDILKRLGWTAEKAPVRLPGFNTVQRVWSKQSTPPTVTAPPIESTPPTESILPTVTALPTGDWDIEDETFEFEFDADTESVTPIDRP